MQIKRIAKSIFPPLIGISILFLIYRDFDFSNFWSRLSNDIDWFFIFISLIFGTLAQIFRAWRWKILLEPIGENPKTSNCINAIFLSYAVSLAIPRIGEISRCGVLKKTDNISVSKSFGTVVSERLIDIVIIMGISIFTFITQIDIFLTYIKQTGAKIPSLTHLLYSPWFYAISAAGISTLFLMYKLRNTIAIYDKLKSFISGVLNSAYSVFKVKQVWKLTMYSLAIWICYFLHFYITMYCFKFTYDLPLSAGLILFVVGTFAVLVPTPNGAGAWHFAIISALLLYGISNDDSSLFALIVHTFQTFLLVLLGGYAYIRLYLK